ncbi:MAG: signal-transduction protein with cAMP-binding, CBS, and nucleotidyltransferase domain [Bradymonadia bacterium]|jgi:signal-transduction protein with cAMP-binding, CBS, and nucleotidyltransferase domain
MSIPNEFWTSSPFEQLSDAQRSDLATCCDFSSYAAGKSIYEAGAPATGAYLLLSGTVGMTDPGMASLGDTEQTLDAGSFFSRGSLLAAVNHRHHCVARTDTVVALLSRNAFLEAVTRDRSFSFRVIDDIVQRGSEEVRSLNHAIHGLLSAS